MTVLLTTHEQQRDVRLMLYARLASILSLDNLKTKDKTALVALAKQSSYALLDAADNIRKPQKWHRRADKEWEKQKPSLKEAEHALHDQQEATLERWMQAAHHVNLMRAETRREPLPTYWDAIRAAHPHVRQLIRDVLRTGSVSLPALPFRSVLVLDTSKKDRVAEHYIGPDAREEILFDLLQTLKRSPFPFRQCPRCQTIFPRSKKQKFCSAVCTDRAFSSAENKERREYLRKANERSRAKKKRLTKQGAEQKRR